MKRADSDDVVNGKCVLFKEDKSFIERIKQVLK
jgi:hypothetical protein